MTAIYNTTNRDGLLVVETIDGEVFVKAIPLDSSEDDIFSHLLELELMLAERDMGLDPFGENDLFDDYE